MANGLGSFHAAILVSGANIYPAGKVTTRPEFEGQRIVTILCSLGERYLSTPLFDGLTQRGHLSASK